ncbi:hypothetical protein, partial [Paenibacillus sp. FSL H8-0259]|uniref:hypothetical protein n=1 Tax=Paenibacillus sp. FSL H8-0259 TaxID=1920423 RepID=UPI001C4C227C
MNSDTHSLFSFQRSSSLSAPLIASPATLIIYHIQPINASSFFQLLFELGVDVSRPEIEYIMYGYS